MSRLHSALLLGCCGILALAVAAGGSRAKSSLESDRVVLDNAHVRVIEFISKPMGNVCGIGTHKHPPHLTIVLSNGRDRDTSVGGKPAEEDLKPGDVFWSDGETHTDVNIGRTDLRLLVVELKPR